MTPMWASDVMQYLPATLTGVGLVGFFMYQLTRYVARRISKDGLEFTKDRTEGNFVAQLLELNKVLTDANTVLRTDSERLSKERAEVLAKMGKLESDNEHLVARLAEAHTDVAILRRKLGLSRDYRNTL